jgi:streptogramin lyase
MMLGQMRAAANQHNSGLDVGALINATVNKTDTDGDGLPDSVEAVLGTDFNNSDSDFDRLDDYNETVIYDSDPLEPDSNHDGLADYFEVANVSSLDVDGDGFSNVWDFDNDNDRVEDVIDKSPFAHSITSDSFHFNIKTNGNPTYITFQLRPQNPDNMWLALQTWDWPPDSKGTMQDLDNSRDDVQIVPMLELTLSSVPNQSEVESYGIGIFSNKAYVPLAQAQSYGANVALSGKMFYPASAPLNLQGNASLIWLVKAKTDYIENGSVKSENTTIVKYRENFTLTGFSVEEDYGSDAGVFYSDDVNQTIAANFLTAYAFLRNNQTSLYDMPVELSNHNVSVNSTIRSLSHRDLALLNVTSSMTPDALDSLPDNQVLPVIAAFESNFTKKELSELGSNSYIAGNNLSVDLRWEPVITTKMLKTSWYNTTTQEALETEAVLAEMQDWGQTLGLDDDTLASMMRLGLAWNVGESTVTRIGDEIPDVGAYESSSVEDFVSNGINSASIIIDLMRLVRYGKYMYTEFKSVKALPTLSTWKALKTSYTSISSTTSKSMKALDATSDTLGKMGLVLDIGFALLGFFLISAGSDWSQTGTLQATVYATAMILYAVALFVIGLLGPIGAIIAGTLAVVDMILGFFDYGFSDLISWLVSLFHKTYKRTDVELGIINTSIDIDDLGENGLNVGDKITFRSFINGTVTRTSDGNWQDVLESYIVPSYVIKQYMPPGTPYAYWMSPKGSFSKNVSYTEYYPTSKNTTYENLAWIKPIWGTINFPLAILFQADYKIFYTDKRVEWDFWNGYHYYRKNITDTVTNELNTLYFDVLPDSINDFARWRQISSLDHDGDGLANNEDTCAWSWDCDGDGLSDTYEQNLGTDPRSSDVDGDGLNDRMELIYNTNLTNWDTDGDNLSDFKEINGWDITFNYSNQSFNMTVRSDPLIPDTDGDGVDDQMEYWSSLNPRSKDSNGDGVVDEPNPKYVTYVNFVKKWGSYGTGDGQFKSPVAVAVDADGYVYVADSGNYRIQKFDSNGNLITKWGSEGSGDGQFKYLSDVAVNAKGHVYVSDGYSNRIQKFDSDGNFITSWSINYSEAIAVDADGDVYVPVTLKVNNSYVDCIQKFDSNGSLIKTSWCEGGEVVFQGITALAVDTDGNIYVTDGLDDMPNHGIYKFNSNGSYITKWGSEGYPDKFFSWPEGLTADSKGFVYIADTENHHIEKFDSAGWFITRWGSYGTGDGEFKYPTGIAVDSKEYVYVSEGWLGEDGGNRIQKFSQITEVPPRNVSNVTDTDGDGLTDINETLGWNVTLTNVTGTFTLHVTSEPLTNDTDFDGLSDFDEYNSSSNPRDVDTDDDGLNDFVEKEFGTNITNYDTDGDGLDDSTEVTYSSDPAQKDSDNDGLSDYDEFNYSSDPRNNDTDGDGLNDSEEVAFNSSLRYPDSDGDLMFDGAEHNKSADPWNPDSDGDGLKDGYELFFNTSVLNNDTDSDGLPDGVEVDNRMNPLNNDTDGDGLDDFSELKNGTDPLEGDTSGNGLKDSEDPYTFAPNVENIWIAYDPDEETEQFVEKLKNYTNITVFKPGEIDNYSSEPHILLVGRPSLENNTAGNITYNLLNRSAPDILARMQESDHNRFHVEYDIWNTSQTVVMLSHPYPSDHYKVLDLFKTLNQTISYPNTVNELKANAIKEMDTFVWVELKNPVKPTIEVTRYNETNTPHKLTNELSVNEKAAGKYLDINVSENVQNETTNNIKQAMIVIYYTASDLDRTRDGDAEDPGDIDESTLHLNWFNTTDNKWETLTTDMNWVYNIEVNTTNDILHDKEYEGYLWANVSHLSLYALSGNERPRAYVNITTPLESEILTTHRVTVNYVESGNLTDVDHADLQLDNRTIAHDTDNDGQYTFSCVPPGTHTLKVTLVDAAETPLTTDTVNFETTTIQHHTPQLNVTPPHSIAQPSDVIDIAIDLAPATKEIYAAQTMIHFNTTVLEVLSITQGCMLSQDGATTIMPTSPTYDNTAGTIEYAEARAGVPDGITSPGVLFNIKFKIKNAPRGSLGEIDLATATLVDPSMNSITPVKLNDGVVEIPVNDPPVAIATTNHTANNAGSKVFLDGSASYDPDGILTKYEWDFDDGYTGTGAMVTHIFDHYKWDGTQYQPYNVVLVVTDSDFATDSTVIQITPWMQGDTNGDGKVNIFDLALMGLSWNTKYGDPDYSDGADLNNDNTINIIDLSTLGLNWGKTA